MLILGLYAGHDGNACLVRDGKILIHLEAERITCKKHQRGLPRAMLDRMFDQAGVTLDDVDLIVAGGSLVCPSGDPHPDLAAVESAIADTSRAVHDFPLRAQDGSVDGWVSTAAALRGRAIPVVVVNHHVAHAALGYYTSPFADCLSVSWDGGGDGSYLFYLRGSRGKVTECVFNPPAGRLGLSIGAPWTTLPLLYPFPEVKTASAEDKYLLDLEGRVMAHAAYGKPNAVWVAALRREMERFEEAGGGHAGLLERLKALGSWAMTGVDFSDFRSPTLTDLSASLQRATEDVMLDVLARVVGRDEPIALSGGCAYNCVANGRIDAARPAGVHVPAAAHDGGLALGAALLAHYHLGGNEFAGVQEQTPYLGLGQWRADTIAAWCAAEDVAQGKIVAWFDGPAESGRRALGARSILGDPRRTDARTKLNAIKGREWFRPVAPAILMPYLRDWCNQSVVSPYMSFSATLRADKMDMVPSAAHVDGSCRPQTLGAHSSNDAFCSLVERFRDLTGVPMVLNTSFNVKEPIVCTPEDALRTFKAVAGIDVLYLHGERYER